MIHKLAVLSALVISAFCAIHPGIHSLAQAPLYPHSDGNYNFAYEVNYPPTGDIKSQHESRRGDTVIGQYSLLQPDGVRRTVDYKADDLRGFRAMVHNYGTPTTEQRGDDKQRDSNKHGDESIKRDQNNEGPKRETEQATPQRADKDVLNAPSAPVAISRTSLFQVIRQNHQPSPNGWS